MASNLSVVKSWLEGFALSLKFHPAADFLTEVMRVSALGFKLDPEAEKYLRRGKYMVKPRSIPIEYFGRSGGYVVSEILYAFAASETWSLNTGVYAIAYVHSIRICDITLMQ